MNVCQHGSLRRSCETCAAEAELKATRQLLDRLRVKAGEARVFLEDGHYGKAFALLEQIREEEEIERAAAQDREDESEQEGSEAERSETQYRLGWKNGRDEDAFSSPTTDREQAYDALAFAVGMPTVRRDPLLQVRVVTIHHSDWENVEQERSEGR